MDSKNRETNEDINTINDNLILQKNLQKKKL